MKKHVKIALQARRIGSGSIWPCELGCGKNIVIPDGAHVHHIDGRGMGGNKYADIPENLAILCVDCHNEAEKRTTDEEFKQALKNTVKVIIEMRRGR